jgi:hypothetical protein
MLTGSTKGHKVGPALLSKMVDNLTFVTAYYKIYDDSDNTDYIDYFLKWAEKGATVVLFLDPLYASVAEKFAPYPKVKVINNVAFEDLAVSSVFASDCNMPASRNEKKDTYKYLVLMNSKLEFIRMAKPHITTTNVAWIDFGITKILKNVDVAWSKVTNIQIPQDKVLIPGCTQKAAVSYDNVHWRFCGGLVFGTLENLLKFQVLAFRQLITMQENGYKLSWEVNVLGNNGASWASRLFSVVQCRPQ